MIVQLGTSAPGVAAAFQQRILTAGREYPVRQEIDAALETNAWQLVIPIVETEHHAARD